MTILQAHAILTKHLTTDTQQTLLKTQQASFKHKFLMCACILYVSYLLFAFFAAILNFTGEPKASE